MRGAGSAGVVAAARAYLSELDLAPFGTADARRFLTRLDRTTEHLRLALPPTARHWGLARKGLNIFLRDCLYTAYLRDQYHLDRAEASFEVPLDSICAARLYQESNGRLPKWPGVRALDPEISARYQKVATSLAAERGEARVHLDALWWGARDVD
jgi:hypothetical protein